MKKPETRLQEKIKKHLQVTFGGIWHKIHGGPFQKSGIGDIIGCCKGYYFNLEVKQDKTGPKYEPTEIQQNQINEVNRNGGCGACVKSVEQADQVVRAYLKCKAVSISKKGSEDCIKIRVSWSVDGTRYRKDIDLIEDCSKLLEKRPNR